MNKYSIQQAIKQLRQDSGLSQEELANRICSHYYSRLSPETLCRFENGKKQAVLNVPLLMKILKELDAELVISYKTESAANEFVPRTIAIDLNASI